MRSKYVGIDAYDYHDSTISKRTMLVVIIDGKRTASRMYDRTKQFPKLRRKILLAWMILWT